MSNLPLLGADVNPQPPHNQMSRPEFLAWESASRDAIDFKRCYVDLAGDLIAGLLLSQIMYWNLPAKNGNDSKLMIQRDGHRWLAKGRDDWYEECRITPKQYDRAAKILEDLGLIESRLFKFAGSPTKHTRVCWETFLRELALVTMRVQGGKMDIPQRSKSNLTFGEKPNRPNSEMDFDLWGNSSTETPAETTTQTFSENTSEKTTTYSQQREDAAADTFRQREDAAASSDSTYFRPGVEESREREDVVVPDSSAELEKKAMQDAAACVDAFANESQEEFEGRVLAKVEINETPAQEGHVSFTVIDLDSNEGYQEYLEHANNFYAPVPETAPEPAPTAALKPQPLLGEDTDGLRRDALITRMVELGVAVGDARRLSANPDVCCRQIAHAEFLGPETLLNSGGWLKTAIEKDYPIPTAMRKAEEEKTSAEARKIQREKQRELDHQAKVNEKLSEKQENALLDVLMQRLSEEEIESIANACRFKSRTLKGKAKDRLFYSFLRADLLERVQALSPDEHDRLSEAAVLSDAPALYLSVPVVRPTEAAGGC